MVRIFRKLVIASMLLYTFVWFYSYFGGASHDDYVIDLLGSVVGYGAVFPYKEYALLYLVYQIFMYIAFILASIGMLFLNKIARDAFLMLTVAAYMATLLTGVVATFEGIALLYSILAMLDGAILALAYLTPLSKNFSVR